MRNIHLATDKDDPRLKYIQIKGGNIYACNSIFLIVSPIGSIFEESIIGDDEEAYIDGVSWKACNMHKAVRYGRNDNKIVAYDKNDNEIGRVELIRGINYPDIPAVIDRRSSAPTDCISMNVKYISIISKILETDRLTFELNGDRGMMRVTALDGDVNGFAILMPMLTIKQQDK